MYTHADIYALFLQAQSLICTPIKMHVLLHCMYNPWALATTSYQFFLLLVCLAILILAMRLILFTLTT